jgi:hypothetical protein
MRLITYMFAYVLLIGSVGWMLLIPAAGSMLVAPTLPMQWWDAMYGLDDDEVIRLVPTQGAPLTARGNRPRYDTVGSGPSLVGSMISKQVRYWNINILEDLAGTRVDGDLIVRIGSPVDRRMRALEPMLRTATGKKIVIEKKLVARDLIIARGRWRFSQAPGADSESANTLHFYTDNLAYSEWIPQPSGNLEHFLAHLEEVAERRVIDEVIGRPTETLQLVRNTSHRSAIRNEENLGHLLENLAQQTGLKFERTRRTTPVWFIWEEEQSQ